jgi:hypothetical protein
MGKVVFDHLLEPVAEGHVRVVKRVEVYGGFGSLLRLIVPKMRRDITQSLATLERQLSALGARRHGHQGHGFGPSQSTERVIRGWSSPQIRSKQVRITRVSEILMLYGPEGLVIFDHPYNSCYVQA